jgi:Cys-tRNA(Pro) deacylase
VLTYHHEVKGVRYAAQTLWLPDEIVIKSLIFQANDRLFIFALMSGDGNVSEKKLARASGHKRVTGYQVGGISPLGTKKPLPVFLDSAIAAYPEVVINAGARGTLVRRALKDLIGLTDAIVVDIRTG